MIVRNVHVHQHDVHLSFYAFLPNNSVDSSHGFVPMYGFVEPFTLDIGSGCV